MEVELAISEFYSQVVNLSKSYNKTLFCHSITHILAPTIDLNLVAVHRYTNEIPELLYRPM